MISVFKEEEQKMKPKLYTFPNWNESSTVFDFEDLTEESFLVLCVRAQINIPGHEHDQHKVFVWKGNEFDEEENEIITVLKDVSIDELTPLEALNLLHRIINKLQATFVAFCF